MKAGQVIIRLNINTIEFYQSKTPSLKSLSNTQPINGHVYLIIKSTQVGSQTISAILSVNGE